MCSYFLSWANKTEFIVTALNNTYQLEACMRLGTMTMGPVEMGTKLMGNVWYWGLNWYAKCGDGVSYDFWSHQSSHLLDSAWLHVFSAYICLHLHCAIVSCHSSRKIVSYVSKTCYLASMIILWCFHWFQLWLSRCCRFLLTTWHCFQRFQTLYITHIIWEFTLPAKHKLKLED